MAQEVGIAYVTVAPSAKGFGKAVEGEIDSGVAGASKSAGGRLKSLATSVVKWGTAAVVGVGAAITGLALKGGISRALNIEDAQAKLRGLGHDTQAVEAIMTDALAAVRGTAFGLDTAATVAATAVAAGIKPGQELEKYLRLTADAATIAGVSMEEMGSILNKTTTAGKVYTQELNQLADRGLPVFQWLQEEYGVTAEELRKMVERGEVDAATFRKVIEDNIGGAALASGDTTRGAFANMRAAISRFGVALLGDDGLGAAKTFFNEVTVIFDGITERVAPLVEKFQDKLGEMFQIEGMGDRFLDWLDETIEKIANGPIPQLLNALAPILPVVGEAAELLGSALGDAFYELGEALAPVLPMIAESLTEAIIELLPPLTDLLIALLPLIPPLADLIAAVVPLVAVLVEFLLPAIQWVVEWVGGMAEAFGTFLEFLSGDVSLEEFALKLLTLDGPFGDVIRWVWESAAAIGDWGRDIGQSISDVVTFFTELPDKIMSALSDAATWLVQTGKDIIQGLINGVESMINDAVAAVQDIGGSMLEGVKDFLGIKSPSRVFRDQVGKMVGLGLLAGIEDQSIRGRIDTAVNHLVEVPASAGSGAGGMPDTVTLVDASGALLGLMDVRVSAAAAAGGQTVRRGADRRY